jgi:hypothetical protein
MIVCAQYTIIGSDARNRHLAFSISSIFFRWLAVSYALSLIFVGVCICIAQHLALRIILRATL